MKRQVIALGMCAMGVAVAIPMTVPSASGISNTALRRTPEFSDYTEYSVQTKRKPEFSDYTEYSVQTKRDSEAKREPEFSDYTEYSVQT